MKHIKVDIPDYVSAASIDELYKRIKELNEPQLTIDVPLSHLKDRTLYISYPSYFEAMDIISLGILVGATLFMEPWKGR